MGCPSVFHVVSAAVDKAAFHFDKLYSYTVPAGLVGKIRIGARVLVPFGGGNRRRQALVLSMEERASEEGLKPVSALLDPEPLLTGEMLELVRYLKSACFCTYYDAVKTILPGGIGYQISFAYRLSPGWRDGPEELSPEERRVAAFLLKKDGPVPREQLCRALGLAQDTPLPDQMYRKGILTREENARRRVGDETVQMARLCPEAQDEAPASLTPKQKSVVEFLRTVGAATLKEAEYFTGVTSAVLRTLEKRGVVEFFEHEVLRTPARSSSAAPVLPISLEGRQREAYEKLLGAYRGGGAGTALLYGVTGSGKTQVYTKLISDVVADGRQAIVLVPEISLTPQTIEGFTARFGDRVAILHSGLSLGERLDEWKRIRAGQVDIAVGTRSAVFAPFERLGLIVIDEEQEHTYKSESAPRYHARDVARFRSGYHGCLTVLASATPSVETYYHAKAGNYLLAELPSRYGGARLPDVELVDMTGERMAGNSGEISEALAAGVRQVLERGEQAILLLNRRGYHTRALCQSCRTALTCPNCSIALTYHAANGRLMCHYCGYSRPMEEGCPQCGGKVERFQGVGTQKLEEEVRELFPQARVLRMDADTTLSKHAHEEKFRDFAEGRYDLMVGTQMVAKGLNFPGVTLVGVLAPDATLFGDDFKSEERTFSLITQVIGRAGRGEKRGRALIQTFVPENRVMIEASEQDYETFYQNEIICRKVMLYPPFCSMCAVGFSGERESEVIRGAESFLHSLTALARQKYPDIPLRVLGCTPNLVLKVSGKYRYKIVIKCKNSPRFRELIGALLIQFGRDPRNKGVTAYGDPYFDGSM